MSGLIVVSEDLLLVYIGLQQVGKGGFIPRFSPWGDRVEPLSDKTLGYN